MTRRACSNSPPPSPSTSPEPIAASASPSRCTTARLLAWLLQQGYTVFGINPKSAQRARDRYRPAGGKDDASDAFILADMLRTDRGSLRAIQPDSDATLELRSLVELRASRVHERTALFHRLRSRLDEWCPDLSRLCERLQPHLATPTARTLPAAAGPAQRPWPNPQRLHSKASTRPRHRRSHPRRTPGHAHARSPDRWPPRCAWTSNTCWPRSNCRCRPSPIWMNGFSRSSTNTPTRRSSSPCRSRAPTPSPPAGRLRRRPRSKAPATANSPPPGASPLTIQSGKHCNIRRRHAADQTLSQALMQFAFNTAFTAGCWASDFYQRKRAEGKAHYTALRCLAQRWLKILHRMWKDRVPYNEQHHQNNQRQRAHRAISTTTT